ncbi:MAG: hypothetical protein ACRC1H_11350, partial [Caldilineaceae bacterium]
LALYSYLFSALMLPAAGLSLLLLWVAERRSPGALRRLGEGVAAFSLAGLLFLPLARNAWLVNDAENAGSAPFAGLLATLDRLLRSWTIWRPGWPAWLETTVIVLFGLLLAAGLLLPRRAGRTATPHWPERGWLALWVLGPVLVGNLMLAGNDSVFAEDRYFLFVAPFALWAIARGAVALGERFAWRGTVAPIVGLALLLAAALPVLWTPARAREEWRTTVAWIAAQVEASPGLRSAIITHVDYTHLPAEWYLRQRFTFDELPLYHPFGATLTPDMLETTIAPPLKGVATEGFDTLYLLQSHLEGVDDGRLVEGWLAQNYRLFAEAYAPGIKLTAYSMRSPYDSLPALNADAQRPATLLAPGIRLAACEVTTPVVAVQNPALHAGPGWVKVRLWSQPVSGGTQNAAWDSRVRLVNEAGVWGEEVKRPPPSEQLPRTTMRVPAFVRHETEVTLNPLTPPGVYRVEVRMVDAAGAEGPEAADCGTVLVN